MTKLDQSYTPHLVVKELSLAPGAEWVPCLSGWTLIQITSGTGYWLQPKLSHELEVGTVLLLAAGVHGNLRASQLGRLSLQFFSVESERMMWFFTFMEQRCFEMAASKDEFMLKVLPAHSPISARMQSLCNATNKGGPSFRLQLLQLFCDAFGNELKGEVARPDLDLDAKERLNVFLKQTPASELIDISIAELAQMARCTPRHVSRIFQEVVGVSFRDRQTELRLLRARELLATTKSKIVNVALDSGYQSLSLFHRLFTRRFRMSPGQWRQTFGNNKGKPLRGLRQSYPGRT